jgi:hypothetical protein
MDLRNLAVFIALTAVAIFAWLPLALIARQILGATP